MQRYNFCFYKSAFSAINFPYHLRNANIHINLRISKILCTLAAEDGWRLMAEGWGLRADVWSMMADGWGLRAEGWVQIHPVSNLTFFSVPCDSGKKAECKRRLMAEGWVLLPRILFGIKFLTTSHAKADVISFPLSVLCLTSYSDERCLRAEGGVISLYQPTLYQASCISQPVSSPVLHNLNEGWRLRADRRLRAEGRWLSFISQHSTLRLTSYSDERCLMLFLFLSQFCV